MDGDVRAMLYETMEGSHVSGGAVRILRERERQMSVEGWSRQHDAEEHTDASLVRAACCYAQYAIDLQVYGRSEPLLPASTPVDWPWEPSWWKPADDPIRNLEKAGALIAAEIDRLLGRGATDER